MAKDKPGFSKNFIISVVMHVIFFTLLVTTMSFTTPSKPIMVNLQKDPKIVKAKVIDTKAIDQALQLQQRQAAEELQKQKLVQEQLLAEQAKQEAAKAKQALELAQQQKLQQEAVAKKAAEVKKVAEQKQAEVAKAKQAKTEQAKTEQTKAAQQALELKKAAEQKQAAQKLAQAAALKAEQDRIVAQTQEILLSEVERFRAEIQATIEDNRILSSVFSGDISCKIRIKLLPDGSILSVNVVEPSGNPAYDEMSAAAVYKSAPFPMPQDQEVYNQLRDIVLSFKNGEQATDVF